MHVDKHQIRNKTLSSQSTDYMHSFLIFYVLFDLLCRPYSIHSKVDIEQSIQNKVSFLCNSGDECIPEYTFIIYFSQSVNGNINPPGVCDSRNFIHFVKVLGGRCVTDKTAMFKIFPLSSSKYFASHTKFDV